VLRVYEIRYDEHYDDRTFVVAETPTQAKKVAFAKEGSKAHDWDWTDLRPRLCTDLDYVIEQDGITEPTFLFDNETYQDTIDELRRWWYANQ
jgi:hypothetical protein